MVEKGLKKSTWPKHAHANVPDVPFNHADTNSAEIDVMMEQIG